MAIIDILNGTNTIDVTSNINLILLRDGRYLTVEGTGIDLNDTFRNDVLIDGTVFAESGILEETDGGSNTILVAEGGEVYGLVSGIRLRGGNSEITNNGLISSSAISVNLSGSVAALFNNGIISSDNIGVQLNGLDHDMINHGVITSSSTAVSVFGSNQTINNLGDISATFAAIQSAIASGETFTLQNSGTISGTEFSIQGFNGNEEITNTGALVGDVSLGAGDDNLDSRDGEVTGRILLEGGDDVAILGSEDNFVDGRAGADMIRGGGGDDEIQGGSGDDELRGGAGDDDIIGEDSNDDIYGGHGSDNLRGNAGADRLFGGTGNDVLAGGSGDDRMNGGRDDDVMTGNGGADRFIFNRQAGNDEITDFNDGVDLIDLRAFNVSTGDVLAATSVVGGNSLIDLDALGGSGSILIEGDTSMSAGDFLV